MKKLLAMLALVAAVLSLSGCAGWLKGSGPPPLGPNYLTVDGIWWSKEKGWHKTPQRAYWDDYYQCYTYGDYFGFHCVR